VLLVLNAGEKPEGVVEREQLVGRFLLALAQ
jgi:hypothetical protein